MPATTSTPKKLSLPPLPLLRLALVRRWEYEHGLCKDLSAVGESLGHKSSETLRRAATQAARLCGNGACWFCGKAYATKSTNKITAKDVNWGAFQLCECFAELRDGPVWHLPAQTPEELQQLRQQVLAGIISVETPVVTRSCEAVHTKDGQNKRCGRRFTLKAGAYRRSIESADYAIRGRDAVRGIERTELQRLEEYRPATKCWDCRNSAAADKAAKPRKSAQKATPSLRSVG